MILEVYGIGLTEQSLRNDFCELRVSDIMLRLKHRCCNEIATFQKGFFPVGRCIVDHLGFRLQKLGISTKKHF